MLTELSDKWIEEHIKGFIQLNCKKSFFLVTFSEKSLLQIIKAAEYGHVFTYLDATGTLIDRPIDTDKKVYLYSLILPGDSEKGPFPVAEFISSMHSVPYITLFLSLVDHALKKLSTRSIIIDKIETDFSLALLQSACLSFNKMSLMNYLTVIFNKHENNERLEHGFTTIHICSSHLVKTVLRKSKTLMKNSRQIRLAGMAIAKLIHCDKLSEARNVFRSLIKVFNLNIQDPEYDECLDMISNVTSDVNDNVIDEDVNFDKAGETIEDIAETVDKTRKESPFYKTFNDIFTTVLAEKNETGGKPNENYCPAFIQYLINHLMPYYGLWSALEICKFGILRDSNAAVENYQKIIKHYIYEDKSNIPAPRFIQKQADYLETRLLERKYSFTTTRQKMNLQKNIGSVKRIAKVILFLNRLNSFANQGLRVTKTMFQ